MGNFENFVPVATFSRLLFSLSFDNWIKFVGAAPDIASLPYLIYYANIVLVYEVIFVLLFAIVIFREYLQLQR